MNNKVKNDVAKAAGDMADFLKSAVKSDDMKKCLESGSMMTEFSDMAIAQQIGFRGH